MKLFDGVDAFQNIRYVINNSYILAANNDNFSFVIKGRPTSFLSLRKKYIMLQNKYNLFDFHSSQEFAYF